MLPTCLRVAPEVIGAAWRHPANRNRRVRQLALAMTFQLRGRVLRRPTAVSLGKRSRIWAYLDDSSSRRAAYANPPDWPEMCVWQALLGPGQLFVDVGADVGLYRILALETGAEVIAVEPRTEAVVRLRENLALNGYSATIASVALSDQPGQGSLAGQDALRHHLVTERREGSNSRTVPIATLDELLGDRYADGVKLDVEGAERLVLSGARSALAGGRIGLLQLEWNSQSRAFFAEGRSPVEDLLRSFGYGLFRPNDAGQLVEVSNPGFGRDVFAKRV